MLSFEAPTEPMRKVAASAGFYKSPWGMHSRLQLLTMGELLAGKRIDYPPARQANVTYKKAQRVIDDTSEQLPFGADPREDDYDSPRPRLRGRESS